MRHLLRHTLIVTAFLFGGEWYFNGGQETQALLSGLGPGVVVGQAKLQGYHFNAGMIRQVALFDAH